MFTPFCALLLIFLILLLNRTSALKALIFIEVFGFLWFFLIVGVFNTTNAIEPTTIILFRLLVLEGVIGLFGLVLLVRATGRDTLNLFSL